MNTLRMALRLAARDLRGGLGGLWILIAGVALGVALMAAVGTLAGGVLDAMRAGARESVGGDVSLRLFHAPPTPAQREALEGFGAVSTVAELRARVAGTLAEVKAVDEAWPLVGTVRLRGGDPLADALAPRAGVWGAVVGDDLADRLGQRLALGAVEVEVRAVLAHEPDRAFRAFTLGPRLIVAQSALDLSGLAGPGAAVYWYSRLRLPEGTEGAAVLAALEQRFPDAGWRMVNAADGIPGVERTVDIARTLFVLAGLGILLIGGVGVGAAVRAALSARRPTIATLKALGAERRLVFLAFLSQVMAASLLAVAVGLAAGTGLAALARPLAGAWAPAGVVHGPALLAAAAVGLLAALLFALPPLSAAAGARPPEVWRGVAPPRAGARTRWAVGTVGAILVALLAAWTGMPLAVAAFAGVALVVTGLLGGVGAALAAVSRRLARAAGGPARRLAWANLGRPEAPTTGLVVAFGLGLTLLVSIAVLGDAALRHVGETLPTRAPALVALNLRPAEAAAVAALGGGQGGGQGGGVEVAPFLHARISRLNGVPVGDAAVPRSVAWAVRGDRGLSWRAAPPAGEIVAGRWWAEDYRGPPLASVDARVAGRLGLAVGDTLTLAMPHGAVTATVANLRRMDWAGLDLDFPVLLSPPAEPPPHSLVAALWAEPAALPEVEARLAVIAPDAPVVRVGEVLSALGGFVADVRRALLGIGGLALVAAAVVLAGAVAASLRQRRREAAVLHALGVGRGQLARVAVLEFVLLGAAVAGLAVPLGLAVAAGVVAAALPDAPVPVAPGLALAVTVGAAAVAGLAAVGAGVALRPATVRTLAREGA
ncbi:ABC transporter permease [Novispirillum sp. DQ9]|uniref:ABC transporter permease n=1 Tax=Novispirillum sp. DQ9 TaxID=3398612 RepID=UPI003C7A67D4